MKTVITTLSVSIVRLEIEGIKALDRIARLSQQRRKVSNTLNKLWRKYAQNPSEELYAKIEMYQEVLKDYEDELNFLISGIED